MTAPRPMRAAIETLVTPPEAFARAAAARPREVVTRHLVLAGRRVRVEIAGEALADRLLPALAHIEIERAAPTVALTIRAWDAEATGAGSPEPLPLDDPGVNGTVQVRHDGQLVVHHRRSSTTWIDRDRGEIHACFESAARVPLFDRGKPFHFALAVWHRDAGAPLVHAAVVAHEGRGLLVPGIGGSGKSTIAVACALAGFSYIGDDTVALDTSEPGTIRAHSVYCSTTLERSHLTRFPALAPHASAGESASDKHLVILNGLLPKPIPRSVPLGAIVLPRIGTGTASRLGPASRASALRRLAPSTLLFFPGWGAAHLDFLSGVVGALPCFEIDMGRDLDRIAACLSSIPLD